MDTLNQNLNILNEYFKDGIKEKNIKSIGLELEHFIVDKNNDSVSYYGENGIEKILEDLSAFYTSKIMNGKYLLGLEKEKANITLEPAGQIEISIGPYEKIRDILKEYEYFYNNLNDILKKYDYSLVCLGYHPKSKIEDLKLIPKARYECMLDYFKNTGDYGKNMMKGSASTQVSIDYNSEEDFRKKFRLSNILSPILSLLTDNTPVFEGEVAKKRMIRSMIWNSVDEDRSMVVKGSLDKDFIFDDYSKYILNTPAILIMDSNNSSNVICTKDKPIKEIYKEKVISKEELQHLISMFFPDVRLKNYVEIRYADSMEIEFALSYTALIKGIFYSEENLNILLDMFKDVDHASYQETKESLMNFGYEGKFFSFDPKEFLIKLFTLASNGLNEESPYLQPLLSLVEKKKTLADIKKESINPIKLDSKKRVV